MTDTYYTLYQVDQKGKTRTWCMEIDGGRYRTVSGILGGKQTTSGWTITEVTNAGKSNERDVVQQARFEIEAAYTKKLEQKYYTSIEAAQAAGTGMKFLQPMLAHKYDDYKSKFDLSKGVYTQPKLDGIRCVVTKDGMFSRQGKPIVACPHISDALASFFEVFPDYSLDGELYNHDLKNDFDKLTSLVKKAKPTAEELQESEDKIQYHIYDVIMPGNFGFRYDFIQMEVDRTYCLKHVETFYVVSQSGLDDVYGEWLQAGYEGQMIRVNSDYEHRRSKSLLKRKEFLDDEFPIVRLEEGLGNWSGAVKRAVLRLPDGREFEAGVRGTMDYLKGMLDRENAGIGPKVATVRFQNYTPDGIPRFGVVTVFHDGEREL